MDNGLNWALDNDYATEDDIEHCEENGFLKNADSSLISQKAKQRAIKQLGSLGSGNHFLEIQKVETIYNETIAKQLGIFDKNTDPDLGKALYMPYADKPFGNAGIKD